MHSTCQRRAVPLFHPVLALLVAGLTAGGSARASLLAYEGFSYPAGSALAGATGPRGFNAPYTSSNSGLMVSTGGLSSGSLAVEGNKVALVGTNNNGNFGILANSPETAGTRVYFSYLIQVDAGGTGYAGVSLFNGTEEMLFTGKRNGNSNALGLEARAGSSQSTTHEATETSLVVCRIDFAANSATIRMYVNPSSSTEPQTADATVTRTTSLAYDRIRFQSNSVTGSLDEFRLGTTFADVLSLTKDDNIPAEVVVLGSSVAAGSGAAVQGEGWGFRVRTQLENTPLFHPESHLSWYVHNASIGGNNTTAVLNRFQADVVNARPNTDIVIIGLSLANEGLVGSTAPQQVFDSFKNGVQQIISRCRASGYYPVVALCYPHNSYNALQYSFIRRMNVLINSWDVPSINLLGTIDDGAGHWVSGLSADEGHPNSQGHLELYSSVVPSLFEAVMEGKKASPQWTGTRGYLRLQRDVTTAAPLVYTPAQAYRSFTLSFRLRTTEGGSVAAVGSGTTGATLEVRSGNLVYISPSGAETVITTTVANGRWHDIALSYRKPVNQVLVFVDGQLKATVSGALSPATLTVGGPGGVAGRAASPLVADYQDVALYRAAWTEDEALAQSNGALQQASLDILATLDDLAPVQGSPLANRAQSLSSLGLQTLAFSPALSSTTPSALTAVSYASTGVSLSWTDNAAGTSAFTIERRRTGVAEAWTVVGTQPGNITNFEDTGLSTGTSYDYRVSVTEGALQSDYSNLISVVASGQNSISYANWIASYYPVPQSEDSVYQIDFNTSVSPDYGGQIWNTVGNRSSTASYPLRDSNNNTSPFTVAISDTFDQDRNDNGNPLPGYPASVQGSQFALRDDNPLVGAITFSGLDPAATYDFTFFARRGSIVSGFDYNGTYTFTGGGSPVAVVVNGNLNTELTQVPKIAPNASGVVTLTITPTGTTGSRFPGINFIKFRKSKPGNYLVDFNTDANPSYGLVKWNKVGSTAPGAPIAIVDTYNNPSPFKVAITDGFDQFRNENGAPLTEFASVAQISQFALRDDSPLTGSVVFSGLDPSKKYDFSFFARRGALVAGFDYTGRYTFTGAGAPVVVVVDAKENTTLTEVPAITPTASGVVSLEITSNVASGQRFPVINFIRFGENIVPSSYAGIISSSADPDGDGMSNLEEYARGFNPKVVDGSPFQVESFTLSESSNPQLTITVDRMARDAGLVLESSTDLLLWTVDTGATPIIVGNDGSMQTLRYQSSLSGATRFYRFKIVQLN